MLWKTLVIGFLVWLSTGGGLGSALSDVKAPFIWWSPAPVERLGDGRARQTLTLETSSKTSVKLPEAWLRVTPLRRYNRPGEPAEAFWLKGEWASASPWTLVVETNGYVTADVFARAEIGGRTHFAQTVLRLFSRSEAAGQALEGLEDVPDVPEFRMSSSGEFYWPQTGHEFTFALEGLDAARNELEIWSGQGARLATLTASTGTFKYTPAHDPSLDRAGYAAGKPLIFMARDNNGGSAAFTLVVHRSRTAGLDKDAGLAVFAAALLLSGLTTWLTRRKARPCW